ncbi:hypothetical protein [Larkinella terrae]|uniref:Uncharacterized protein n=1 Tax=Larkinella terrae TaxID=2025311 RepID=A0A7K0EIZ6_9BACT|nr:hypothetical protein [Larkinella terrae]MRS61823.1 hypothetical protein [Larkinella terrae]
MEDLDPLFVQVMQQAKTQRRAKFSRSGQLSLGDIIDRIEPLIANQPDVIELYKEEATVRYDFGYLFPTEIDSWRGSYDELALNYTEEGKETAITAFLELLKSAVGKTFEGYKGGDYVMNENTPVWVANYGNSGNTAIIDVLNQEHTVILITAYREF